MHLTVRTERWDVDGTFTISRRATTQVPVIVVEVRDGDYVGRGEARGVDYHGETVESMHEQLEGVRGPLRRGLTRAEGQTLLPAGGARNALDCALWDLEAKRSGQAVWQLAGLAPPRPLVTAYTISLAEPSAMAAQAHQRRSYPLLKIKLGTDGDDVARVRAVREAAPKPRLIVDANEGWSLEQLGAFAPALHALGVELIEQPLPARADAALDAYAGPIPLCADESCQTTASLPDLSPGYTFVNIKLDKTGGLTEALHLLRAAEARGLRRMVGCMLGTSLSMAPAALVGQQCEFVDLDGPLLLAQDRDPGCRYTSGHLQPPPRALWG